MVFFPIDWRFAIACFPSLKIEALNAREEASSPVVDGCADGWQGAINVRL
jgi:hypothetical protein